MSVSTHALLWLAGIATVGAAFQPTQDPAKKPDPKKSTPPPAATTPAPAGMSSFASLDDVIGCEIVFDRAGASTDAVSKKEEGSNKGKVKDLVVSTSDGRITGFAVTGGEVGDRTVLVPATSFNFNMVEKKPCYMLRMSKAEIDAHPDFDAKKAEKEGLDKEVERMRALPGKKDMSDPTKKESGEAGIAPDKSEKPMGAMAYVLGTQIKGCEIDATDKHFGKVRDAAVDTKTNAVSYLLVSHGGVGTVGDTVYTVPFSAARWARDEDNKSVLKLSRTSDELKAAPEYKKPDHEILTADQARTSDAFWGGRKTTSPN